MSGNGYIAGNWGTVLMKLADSSSSPSEASQYRRDAAHLLDIAIKVPPKDEMWLLNRVYLEQKIRKADPSGFAAFCDGIGGSAKVASACGKGLHVLTQARRGEITASERERLTCKAATWARDAAGIQDECVHARQELRKTQKR